MSGFTLVELLVTVALVGLVAASIAAMFAGGFQVWDRVVAQGTDRQRLQLAWAQVRQELRGMTRFEPIGFKGAYDEVSFPVYLETSRTTNAGELIAYQELGQAGFYFDRYHRQLCRSQVPYRLMRRRRLKDACSPVLTDVDYVRFSYYTFDPVSERYQWSGSWTRAEPPAAVKMDVRLKSPTSKQAPRQSVTLPVPIAPVHHPGSAT